MTIIIMMNNNNRVLLDSAIRNPPTEKKTQPRQDIIKGIVKARQLQRFNLVAD